MRHVHAYLSRAPRSDKQFVLNQFYFFFHFFHLSYSTLTASLLRHILRFMSGYEMCFTIFFFQFYNGYALCCGGVGRQAGRSLGQFGQVLIIMVL